ncbi:DUF4429 domain-containing protein [Bacillus cereus]
MKEFKAYNGVLIVDDKKITIMPSRIMGMTKRVMEIYYEDIKKIEFEKPKLLTNGYLRFELISKSGTKKNKIGSNKRRKCCFLHEETNERYSRS